MDDVVIQAQVDTAHAVDEILYSKHGDFEVVVHRHTGEVLDRFYEEFWAADGVGGVDLVLSLPGNFHPTIAGERHQRWGP